jgi:hypothetical protein
MGSMSLKPSVITTDSLGRLRVRRCPRVRSAAQFAGRRIL